MQRIGIFGGTYNPPHIGHVNIVSAFLEEFSLSKVLIIPTYTPPHKISADLASPEDRFLMCNYTFTDPHFEVSDLEIQRQGKSYTYETLRELKDIYKDTEFYFLVGDDMIMSLHTWRKAEEILELCTLVAASRTETFMKEDMDAYLLDKYPKQFKENRFSYMQIDPLPLSSTLIREKIKNKESINGLVTKETEDYIFSRGIYNARA